MRMTFELREDFGISFEVMRVERECLLLMFQFGLNRACGYQCFKVSGVYAQSSHYVPIGGVIDNAQE